MRNRLEVSMSICTGEGQDQNKVLVGIILTIKRLLSKSLRTVSGNILATIVGDDILVRLQS